MSSYVLVSLMMLVILLLGVALGVYISLKFIKDSNLKPMLVYVDEINDRQEKKKFWKKKPKKEEFDDEDDMFLLSGRISDEVSLTERECISRGLDIQEVVKENQTDVDNAFEYLAIENDELDELDEISYIEEVDVTDVLEELNNTEE